MAATRDRTPGTGSRTSAGRHRRARHAGLQRRARHPGRDAGHEAVGQALLISIGLAGMLAATRLAEVSTDGMTVLMNALR